MKNRSNRNEESSQEREKGKNRSGTTGRKEEPAEEKEKARGHGHRACKGTQGDVWSFTDAQISLRGTASCLPQSHPLCGKPARELFHFLLWAERDTQDATKLHLALPLQGSPALQYFVQALPPGGLGSNNYKAGWVFGLGWNQKHSTKS